MQAAMNATPMEQAAYIGLLALAVSDALYCISALLKAGEFFSKIVQKYTMRDWILEFLS